MEIPRPLPPTDASHFGRLVVRARRLGDLSQRELAMRLGVSHSTVCRIESGQTGLSVTMFAEIMALAGLSVTVTGANGREVLPVSSDTARDNAHRRFPAHLDVGPPDVVTREELYSPRYDRMPARGKYHHREQRDRLRRLDPTCAREAVAIGQPDVDTDHPTVAGLELRRRLMRGRQPRIDPAPRPEIECDCPIECFERACLDTCPCQCEAERSPLRRHLAAQADRADRADGTAEAVGPEGSPPGPRRVS